MDKECDGAGTPPAGGARDGDKRDGEARQSSAASREERLAMQLRENLKKRKALARVKRQSDAGH